MIRKHSDPGLAEPRSAPFDVAERLAVRCLADTKTGCWEWTASTARGYAQFSLWGKGKKAHRVFWEQCYGKVPAGLQLDHLCRNTTCINPSHLEPVTPRTNTLRGSTLAARNASVTHCPAGHELSGANLRRSGGRRFCRACGREKQRRFKERRLRSATLS